MLSRLYSAQADFFDAQLSAFDRTSQRFFFGQAVGQALLNLRVNDMDARDGGYIPSPKRGRHRRNPDNPGQGFNSPFYGAQNRTFAVSERHDLNEPPFDNGANQKYRQALRDVRTRGIRPDLMATLPSPLFDGRRPRRTRSAASAKPQETRSSKKGAAKGSAEKGGAKKGASKKGAAQEAAAADVSEQEQDFWPSGISEQDEAPPAVQGAWPPGISEK